MTCYGVASVSRIHKIIGLFCKRDLQKRLFSAKETYNLNDPTNHSHPIYVSLVSCIACLFCLVISVARVSCHVCLCCLSYMSLGCPVPSLVRVHTLCLSLAHSLCLVRRHAWGVLQYVAVRVGWQNHTSCHTRWMSHVTRKERVMSHVLMSHVTLNGWVRSPWTNESCHTKWMRHVTLTKAALYRAQMYVCLLYEYHTRWMSHVTMNESCHTYWWVMSQ